MDQLLLYDSYYMRMLLRLQPFTVVRKKRRSIFGLGKSGISVPDSTLQTVYRDDSADMYWLSLAGMFIFRRINDIIILHVYI